MSRSSKAKEREVKRMNLNVPVELHNSFKAATAARGQNMTDVLMEFIRSYVAKHTRSRRDGASEARRPLHAG